MGNRRTLYGKDDGPYQYAYASKNLLGVKEYFGQELLNFFLMILNKLPKGKRVLDLGSGEGSESAFLQESFPDIVVVSSDLSDAGTVLGYEKGLNQVQSDAVLLPYKDESFSAIHSKDLLVHIKNKDDFFSEVSRVLQSRGYFCLVTAIHSNAEMQFSWDKDQLLDLAKKNGLIFLKSVSIIIKDDDWYKNTVMPRSVFLFQKK